MITLEKLASFEYLVKANIELAKVADGYAGVLNDVVLSLARTQGPINPDEPLLLAALAEQLQHDLALAAKKAEQAALKLGAMASVSLYGRSHDARMDALKERAAVLSAEGKGDPTVAETAAQVAAEKALDPDDSEDEDDSYPSYSDTDVGCGSDSDVEPDSEVEPEEDVEG